MDYTTIKRTKYTSVGMVGNLLLEDLDCLSQGNAKSICLFRNIILVSESETVDRELVLFLDQMEGYDTEKLAAAYFCLGKISLLWKNDLVLPSAYVEGKSFSVEQECGFVEVFMNYGFNRENKMERIK